jgi:hypothetical protein
MGEIEERNGQISRNGKGYFALKIEGFEGSRGIDVGSPEPSIQDTTQEQHDQQLVTLGTAFLPLSSNRNFLIQQTTFALSRNIPLY